MNNARRQSGSVMKIVIRQPQLPIVLYVFEGFVFKGAPQ